MKSSNFVTMLMKIRWKSVSVGSRHGSRAWPKLFRQSMAMVRLRQYLKNDKDVIIHFKRMKIHRSLVEHCVQFTFRHRFFDIILQLSNVHQIGGTFLQCFSGFYYPRIGCFTARNVDTFLFQHLLRIVHRGQGDISACIVNGLEDFQIRLQVNIFTRNRT